MNIKSMKETFYKRYGASGNFLHYTETGATCNLLGHSEISGSSFLTCRLSMGVGMLVRRLDGNTVKVQNTASDKCFSYTRGTPTGIFKGREKSIAERIDAFGQHGAQILYKSDMPDFLSGDTEFNLTLTRALNKIENNERDKRTVADIAALSEPAMPYVAAAFGKGGYCTLVSEGTAEVYPLPLTGYKIITAYCVKKEHDRSAKIEAALERIHKKYPPAGLAEDLTDGHIACVRDKTAADYLRHLSGELRRIRSAAEGLLKCDITSLFDEMNASQKSMERLWNLDNERVFLAQAAANTDGVRAVRCCGSMAVIIAEEDFVNHAVNTIKTEFENNIGYSPSFCISEA